MLLAAALLLSAATLPGCGGPGSGPPPEVSADAPGRCLDSYDPNVDYFPEKPTPRYAELFDVEYFRHYKVVTVNLPESTARYVLVHCGAPTPVGVVAGTLIEVPVQRVITLSTTELPHLERLGLLETLVGHDELDYVSSPEVRRRMEEGRIAEVGESFRLNLEVVFHLEPDLVLAASLGGNHNDSFLRLAQAGIPVAHLPSFLERSPLGQAEWFLFTALFWNAEAEAAALFDDVARRYEDLAALGRGVEYRPRTFASGPEGDTWYMPGGQSLMAQLVADAGGQYLWAENGEAKNVPLAIESVFERAREAEVWLHPSRWRSLEEIAAVNPLFTSLRAFREGRIYQNDARWRAGGEQSVGANDYWEMGTARPDLVLADLLKIFHPELVPDHEFAFHRPLAP